MKKYAVMLLGVLSLSLVLCGAENNVETLRVHTDGAFNKAYGHGWWINRAVSPKGKASIVKEASNFVLRIETQKDGMAHVCSDADFAPDKSGKLNYSVKVKGSGIFAVGVYYYAKSRYVNSSFDKNVTVNSSSWTTLKGTISMANIHKNATRGKIVLFKKGEGVVFVDDFSCSMTRPVLP